MNGKIIVFQGDSITDAGRSRPGEFNTGLGNGYVALTAARLLADYPERELKIFNRGISGHRIVDLYARWKIDTLNLQPDILSILIGVNDTWHDRMYENGVEVKRYAEFYRMLLEWTLTARPGIQIVLIDPFVLPVGVAEPDWLPEIAARGEKVRELAAEFKLLRVPAAPLFEQAARKAPAEYWLHDGVHPTLAGHQLLADCWLTETRKLFA